MTHTNLVKNELYLIVTSIISMGVLSGYDYFNLVLAALLMLPIINLPYKKIFSRERLDQDSLNKCASCK